MVIRFDIDSVRKTGRNALGVRLVKFNEEKEKDKVVGIAKIDASAQALDEEDDMDLVADSEAAQPGPDESGTQPKLV